MKRILIGGSPCTYWSSIQKNRETQAVGTGWELFKNFLKAKEKFKPDFFIYENNKSIHSNIKNEITKCLGVENQTINSALVSAQNRIREYWHNSCRELPEDSKINLQDILEYGMTERKKSKTVRCGGAGSPWGDKHEWDRPYKERVYTTLELERLQTLPDNYTKAMSDRAARKALGNGWTAEIIIHILRGMNIKSSEDIIILSLYDGIATGRYCIKKIGFENVKYFAYEIDEEPIKAAMHNFPDIVELGDAFKVRENSKHEWEV